MERRPLDRQSVWFYLCVAASALALCSGAAIFALYARTGSLGWGLGLGLAASLLGAVGYAHASPLNKARCKLWFWLPVGVLGIYFVLFVLCDLCRLRIAYNAGESGNGYSVMAIVATVFAALCLAGIAFLVVRMVLLATGRYATEAENRYARDAETELPQDIRPRAIDHEAVVAQAEHELDATRMVVESEERIIVTPERARARAAARPVVAEQPEVTEVSMDEEDAAPIEGTYTPIAAVDAAPAIEVPPVATTASAPARSATPAREAPELPVVHTDIAPLPVAADARTIPDPVCDDDIRAETTVQHTVPRSDGPTTDFTDFSYDSHDDD